MRQNRNSSLDEYLKIQYIAGIIYPPVLYAFIQILITVVGTLKNYNGTIEFEKPNLVAILPAGDFSSVGTVMILIAGIACLAVAFTSKKKMA